MISRRQFLLLLLASAGLLALPPAAFAKSGGGGGGGGGGHDDDDDDGDDDGGDDDSDDDDLARDAVRNGRAASLQEILAIIRKKYTGQVVRVRLTGNSGRLVYRIRILDPQNRLIEIRINAVTRRIVGVKGV